MVELLRTVKQAQRVGFTLAEIEELLRVSGGRGGGGEALRERLRGKIGEIDGRIAALGEMRARLTAALHAGCDALTHCADESCPFWTGPHTVSAARGSRRSGASATGETI